MKAENLLYQKTTQKLVEYVKLVPKHNPLQ